MDALTREPVSPGVGTWHLTSVDHVLIAAKSRANRLRFAIMLLFFRERGRFPRSADVIDAETMVALTSELGVPLPTSALVFDGTDRTLERQRTELRAFFDFREATVADAAALGAWLCDHAVARIRSRRLLWSCAHGSRSSRGGPVGNYLSGCKPNTPGFTRRGSCEHCSAG